MKDVWGMGEQVRCWPTDLALAVLHGPDRCGCCGGSEWVVISDPLYPAELLDVRCPACVARRGGQ